VGDRKYRQRGYMDDDRDRKPEQRPRADPPPREMRAPNFPGFTEAVRCARCGRAFPAGSTTDISCEGCGCPLHACVQCASFDPGSRFECMQPVTTRIDVKDARNSCELFEPRVRVERQTRSPEVSSARSAFDDLFKF
jgi:hypothetical protein